MLKYNDFISKGDHNKATHLDNNWILKSPLKVGEGENQPGTMKEILSEFEEHIKTMKMYPELFPKVKKLDRYRAAIEKVNVRKAKIELKHVYGILCKNSSILCDYGDFIEYIVYYDKRYLEILKEHDDTCKKWYIFLKLLIKSDLFYTEEFIDLHEGNFGIDKQGNIKLIDF